MKKMWMGVTKGNWDEIFSKQKRTRWKKTKNLVQSERSWFKVEDHDPTS
jgi:hypothetical protein